MKRTYADAIAEQALERAIAARGGAPWPARITQALDLPAGGGPPLEGPEVDVACGAVEPAVDRWETGEEIPTLDQLQRLADLTGYRLGFFFLEPVELDVSAAWFCVRSGKGKGCYRGDDPALERALAEPAQQLELTAAPPRVRRPRPVEPPLGVPVECTGPCGRPMARDTWRRQRGRCSRCGPP